MGCPCIFLFPTTASGTANNFENIQKNIKQSVFIALQPLDD
jgi:hypothetical protein